MSARGGVSTTTSRQPRSGTYAHVSPPGPIRAHGMRMATPRCIGRPLGGHVEAIGALLKAGADKGARTDGETPLHRGGLHAGGPCGGTWRGASGESRGRSGRAGKEWRHPAALAGGRPSRRRGRSRARCGGHRGRFSTPGPIRAHGMGMASPRCILRPVKAMRRPSGRFSPPEPIRARGTRMAGPTAFDLIQDDSPLVGTELYWRLNDARWD